MFSFFLGNQWVYEYTYIKSNCRPKAPPGPTGLSLPPRSHAECLVPFSQTIRSALALNLCCIRYHWRSYPSTWNYSTHLCPRNSHTHTETTAPNSQLEGDRVRGTAKSPHPSLLFSHFCAGLPGYPYFLPYQNPHPTTPSFGPLSMTWEFKKCLVIHLDANACCVFSFTHSANIYWAYTTLQEV